METMFNLIDGILGKMTVLKRGDVNVHIQIQTKFDFL